MGWEKRNSSTKKKKKKKKNCHTEATIKLWKRSFLPVGIIPAALLLAYQSICVCVCARASVSLKKKNQLIKGSGI